MKPQQIDNLTLAFPGSVVDLMPPYSGIPEEFKNQNRPTKWNKVVSQWFFSGLPSGTEFVPLEGVSKQDAMRHLATIMRSWEPQHEHKEAACAYLMSQWFKDVIIPVEVEAA